MFSSMDEDGDKKITQEEFIGGAENHPTLEALLKPSQRTKVEPPRSTIKIVIDEGDDEIF